MKFGSNLIFMQFFKFLHVSFAICNKSIQMIFSHIEVIKTNIVIIINPSVGGGL